MIHYFMEQKYRESLKKNEKLRMMGCKDKDGTSSEHIQSRCQMEEHPPMTQGFQSVTWQLSQEQQAPAAKNTQGFQSVTWPSETNFQTIGGSTSCGNQSNALMTQMVEAFSSEQIRNEFTGGQPFDYESFLNDFDASTNDISGDPGFFSIDHGEYGFSLDGMFENFTGDVIAREHFRTSDAGTQP